MAILDKLARFADDYDVSGASVGTNTIGTIDMNAARDVGAGMRLSVVIQVKTAFASAGNTGYFQLASDGVTPVATSGQTIHSQGPSLAQSAYVVESKWELPLPAQLPAYERYLGLQLVIATAVYSAGVINAWLDYTQESWEPPVANNG